MTAPAREYFYRVDLRGRLWHANTVLTDPQFLDFFFRRLRANDSGRHREYPYVSPCAGEQNYLRCEDRAIVFHTLTADGHLLYAATLRVPFDPLALRHSAGGRLYHTAPIGELGLLRSDLALSMMERLREDDRGYVLEWQGASHPIRRL